VTGSEVAKVPLNAPGGKPKRPGVPRVEGSAMEQRELEARIDELVTLA
jgi:hypothetical protein